MNKPIRTTVNCIACGKELMGNDKIYFIIDDIKPYCTNCTRHLPAGGYYNTQIVTAKEWLESDLYF